MRATVRWWVALALVVGTAREAEGPAGAAPPEARLVLASDGTTMRWVPGEVVVVSEGPAARVLLDATSVVSARSDVVRLRFEVTDGPGLAVTTPSPFGGVEPVATASTGAPGEGYAQAGRVVPLDLTFTEPGRHRVLVSAAVPGASGPLEAGTELTVSTAVGAPTAPTAERDEVQTWPRTMRGAVGPVVISEGHVDMGPRMVDGSWRIQLKDDTVQPAVWRELADVVLRADDTARMPVPAGDQFAFLGTAGEDVWLLPQAQQPGIVWPGWNTQDPSIAGVATGPVTWRLLGVDGPGSFALFLTGSFGAPEVIFDSDRGLPQQHQVAMGTHVHGSWAFSEPGIYRLDVEMAAPTRTGSVADSRSLVFAVGAAVDPQQGFDAGASGAGSGGTSPGAGAPQQQVSTSLGSSTGGSADRVGGVMASTGLHGLVAKVGSALVLVGLGTVLLRVRRDLKS